MEVISISKYNRISPRKARLVADIVRGEKASSALSKLRFVNKKSAELIAKTLKTAIANAENNFKLNKDDLVISQIMIDEGPTLKRMMPRARGSANQIKKRTSHIKIVLIAEEKKKVKKETVAEKTTAKNLKKGTEDGSQG